jgi:hypothetical protein
MPLYLYIPEGTAWLAERALQSVDAKTTEVFLIAPQGRYATAEVLQKRYDCVHRVFNLDTEAEMLPQLLESEKTPRVTLPLSVEMMPLRYRQAVQMPCLAEHYPLFHTLGRLGFQEFEFCSPGGRPVFQVPHLLDDFQNRHQGERCFVVGNGPSLNQIDMTKLRNEITLGANRCYLGYETWGFPFSYWGIYDKYQIETYGREYEENIPPETVKFFPMEYLPLLDVENGCPLNLQWSNTAAHAFSDDPTQIYVGYMVTYMLLQIAAVMGCDPIILIGVDHHYELNRRFYSTALRRMRRTITRQLRGGVVYNMAVAAHREWIRSRAGKISNSDLLQQPKTLWNAGDAESPTHFDQRYTRDGAIQFLPPEPEEADADFLCAAEWARKKDIRILNATPGSRLKAFPEVDYGSLF